VIWPAALTCRPRGVADRQERRCDAARHRSLALEDTLVRPHAFIPRTVTVHWNSRVNEKRASTEV
jgi:hypothetical protein